MIDIDTRHIEVPEFWHKILDIMCEEGVMRENVDVLLSKPATLADLNRALDTAVKIIKS
ncbi:MAG: hypothetical protein PHR77_18840 [Kiritimatiellae bacterium]|nr:hypothetical protein [Kiritimatiellia bacterium]MDD5519772.1 hypothetical protein [Kiritimatiellia bacterium]